MKKSQVTEETISPSNLESASISVMKSVLRKSGHKIILNRFISCVSGKEGDAVYNGISVVDLVRAMNKRSKTKNRYSIQYAADI